MLRTSRPPRRRARPLRPRSSTEIAVLLPKCARQNELLTCHNRPRCPSMERRQGGSHSATARRVRPPSLRVAPSGTRSSFVRTAHTSSGGAGRCAVVSPIVQSLPATGTVPTVNADAQQWVAAFAEALGVEPPTDDESNDLLALAGIAAHSSERTAAPITCWILARAGLSPKDGKEKAQELAERLGD